MAGGGARACIGKPDLARGWERSGEGGRERLLCELKGVEKAEGAGEIEKRRTARLGASTVLVVRAGRRRRVARSRSVGEEPGARRVADQWTGCRPQCAPAENGVVTARNREERGEMVVRAKP